MRKHILVLFCTFYCLTAFSQSTYIKGRVFDAYSHNPLEGATVSVAGKQAAITGKDGVFSVLYSDPLAEITIEYIGYDVYSAVPKNTGLVLQIGLIASNTSLNNVEISANIKTHSSVLKNPQAIGILSRRELTRNDGVFLENSLNLVPGVRMEKRTANGGQRIVIRGYGNASNFNGSGIKAYLNGIPVTDAEGTTIFDDIDFSTLGKVEVIKGPASALYGNGIGGVVKLFTLKPSPQASKVTQEFTGGSYGLWSSNTRLESAGDKSSVLVNYGHQNYDGYRVHSSARKDFVNLLADFTSGEKSLFSIYAAYNNSYNGLAGQLDSASFFNKENKGEDRYLGNDGHSAYESYRTGLSHKYNFSNTVSNTTSTYFTNYKLNQTAAPSLSSNMVSNVGGRTEFNFNFPGQVVSITGTAGAEYQKTSAFKKTNAMSNSVLGALTTDLEVASFQYSFFTEWNVILPAGVTAIAGAGRNTVRYNITDKLTNTANPTHLDQSGSKTFKAVITPHFAIQKMFAQNITLYASLSKGYSPPATGNVVIPVTGEVVKDLKPESATQYEIGSKGSLLNKKLSYQLALFSMKIKDKLNTQAAVDEDGTVLYSYSVNAGIQQNKGIELSVNYAIIDDRFKTISLVRPFINYSYSHFRYTNFKSDNNNNEKTVDYSGNKTVGVPPHNLSAGVDIGFRNGLYLFSTFQHIDKMPISYDNMHNAPAYSLLNFKAGYKRNIGKRIQLDLFAGSNNVTGKLYYNMVFLNSYTAAAANPNIYLPGPYKATVYGGFNFSYIL
ncbi:TonB-dependent receptor [Foetidibacter luteolus]|uniref:TonB-dependent receptor n=1 Tax=Foetidibacter luteolus TaxID=2608880 RepID=UPI001A996D39|nr:TonB-dependent receptor [Foetidibacter luteolus]